MSHRAGDWFVYCDICGRRIYASKSTKLSTYTGKGGLVVCSHDVDKIDAGLMPYRTRKERSVPWTRVIHTNTDNGSALVDLEQMAYIYYLSTSQADEIIMSSQDVAWLYVSEPL